MPLKYHQGGKSSFTGTVFLKKTLLWGVCSQCLLLEMKSPSEREGREVNVVFIDLLAGGI